MLPGPGQGDLHGVLVELPSSSRREGVVIGTWSIEPKLAAAPGVGIALRVAIGPPRPRPRLGAPA